MPKRNYDQSEYQELASKYRPLLVLYSEIPSGSVRTTHPSWRAGGPPLTHDYHPRDIRLVLENAAILGDEDETGDWEIMLERNVQANPEGSGHPIPMGHPKQQVTN